MLNDIPLLFHRHLHCIFFIWFYKGRLLTFICLIYFIRTDSKYQYVWTGARIEMQLLDGTVCLTNENNELRLSIMTAKRIDMFHAMT